MVIKTHPETGVWCVFGEWFGKSDAVLHRGAGTPEEQLFECIDFVAKNQTGALRDSIVVEVEDGEQSGWLCASMEQLGD